MTDYRIKMLEQAISLEVKKLYRLSIEDTYKKAKASEKIVLKTKKQLKTIAAVIQTLQKDFKPTLNQQHEEKLNSTLASINELKAFVENDLQNAEGLLKKKGYLPPVFNKSNLIGASLMLYGFIADDNDASWIYDLLDESSGTNKIKLKKLISKSISTQTQLDELNRIFKKGDTSGKRVMPLTGNLMPKFNERKKLTGFKRDELRRTLLSGSKIRFENDSVLNIVASLIIFPQWFKIVESIVNLKFASPQIDSDSGIVISLSEDGNSLYFSFSKNGITHKENIIENFEEAFNLYFN